MFHPTDGPRKRLRDGFVHSHALARRTAALSRQEAAASVSREPRSRRGSRTSKPRGNPLINGSDTAWLMTASVLVLLMTLPALALFYGGLVQSKNILSVLVQCCAVACVASLLWFACGYSLAYSGTGDWLGDLSAAFLQHGGRAMLHPGTGIPESVFVMFQMTFAIITPALIIGAYVERIRFDAVLLVSAL